MFTANQLDGIAEIDTLAQAWAMAQQIAPTSCMSLAELLEALQPPERPAYMAPEHSALSSSQAADTLPGARQRAG